MRKIIVLLFLSTQVFSQSINLKGKLLDSNTKEPIVYANISFLKSNKGISSLEDGTFNLEIDKKLLKEKVHVSCLNYKDTIVFANQLNDKILFLKADNLELDEVFISKKVNRELIVKKIKKRKIKISLIGTTNFPFTVARYFEFKKEYVETPFIKKVTIFLGNDEKRKAKFRVRFFLKDSVSSLPKNDLLKESLIVSVDKRQKKIEIDLLKYDLEIPKKGIFIVLERLHVPDNFYEDTFNYKDSISKKVTRVAPDFGGVAVFDEKRYTYRKGKWFSQEKEISYYKGKTIVPAISLTLTN